ncbi:MULTISPECIES: peptide-methionine (S)-S-oxide reductase MsrA [Bacillaceae]|uniref:Peptide methionine sulfoxide reductase MsrA n=1 Tax=Alkalicoccobacillus plakortidis TaxID=444060 RepID=A0A9D5DK00_9BACI|nr:MULTISPECIES: peptide-methionine (S)-S-oxide reductase MsrA [Bacillaceae]KQL51747.1 methionine sulfoxide reductase A [Alkalicoccobacillus plakortidis]
MKREKATFAGGCFWCMVQPFDELPGIQSILSGYMGGTVDHPTYEQVKTGETGHFEVVQITFDSETFSYDQLLDLYWPQIDPTDDGGQFHDRGSQYRTAIFYENENQRIKAEETKKKLQESNRFKKPIVTEVLPASTFYVAEDDHQDFYKKQPNHYKQDRKESGRDTFIQSHWKQG